MRQGMGVFGKRYEVMYKNDTHADGSVDKALFSAMIKLDTHSAPYLYGAYYGAYTDLSIRYKQGDRPSLEAITARLRAANPSRTIRKITAYCRDIVEHCAFTDEQMVFGGTEEAIIERGSYWCADIARVACALFQTAGFPSRIVITANTCFPYCGHSVTEVYYDGNWGVVDPTNGVVFTTEDDKPLSAWSIHNDPAAGSAAFYRYHPQWEDVFPPGEQYESVAIANYYVGQMHAYSYQTSSLNDYCRAILIQSEMKWPGGIRWLHGEDAL